jgi:hypothetical protein
VIRVRSRRNLRGGGAVARKEARPLNRSSVAWLQGGEMARWGASLGAEQRHRAVARARAARAARRRCGAAAECGGAARQWRGVKEEVQARRRDDETVRRRATARWRAAYGGLDENGSRTKRLYEGSDPLATL